MKSTTFLGDTSTKHPPPTPTEARRYRSGSGEPAAYLLSSPAPRKPFRLGRSREHVGRKTLLAIPRDEGAFATSQQSVPYAILSV